MPEPGNPPPPLPVRRSWRRARVYGWAILLVLALEFFAGAVLVRRYPQRLVDRALAQLPYQATVGSTRWLDTQTLQLTDLKVGDFFYASSVAISASPLDLIHHRIASLTINGPQLYMAAFNRAISSQPTGRGGQGLDWTIAKLTLQRGVVLVDGGRDLPAIPVGVGARRPVIVNNLRLGSPDAGKGAMEEHLVELENIHIASPFDPLAPVLSLPLVRLRFTYGEIWRHKIREIDLVHPNLYLGQDLFWFTDEIKKERKQVTVAGPDAPWNVGHFAVQYGQLSINAFGQPRVTFPFFFDTDVDDIQLDQLDKISARNVIAIRHLTKDYPDYKIKIRNLHGQIDFSIPPTDAKANNVVPTIRIDELSWNDIPVTQVWSSVTFDPTGIYAKLGGNCEKGFMNGNFEVYYTNGFLWNADFFATKVECEPITEKLGGKYARLTGTLNGKIAVKGRATEILACNGLFAMAHPGILEIKSADDLMQRIPADWIALKKDAVKIALNAFRLYPYETGEVKIDYQAGGGEGTLKLDGPNGKRDFGIYWHPIATSKVAKDDDRH